MSAHDQHKKLVEILLRRSQAGDFSWKETADDNAFNFSVGKNAVRITKVDGFRGDDIIVSLINSSGEVADYFSDTDLDGSEPGEWYRRMTELFETARRNALGADKILNEIILELDDEIPF